MNSTPERPIVAEVIPLPAVHQYLPEPVEGRRVVGYERYAGDLLVPVYEAPPLPVQPQPIVRHGMDPISQRLIAAGVGTGAAGAGLGWGLGQAAAGLSSGGGLFLLCLLAAWKLSSARGASSSSTTTIRTEVHNHNKWFGRSSTSSSTRV